MYSSHIGKSYVSPSMQVIRIFPDIIRTSDGTVIPPEPDWCAAQGKTPEECYPGAMG